MYCLHVLHVSLSSLLRLTAILPGYPGYISCWISPTNLLARLRVSCLSLFVPSLFHFIHSFMFYVIFDHSMDWGDYGDSDTDSASFTDRSAAFAFASDIHRRVRHTDGCTDRWFVRRIMHDDCVIDWNHAG